jgi:hypothetical protein
MKIFIDEYGDLGFSAHATAYFIVGFILVDNEWKINVDLERYLRKMRERGIYKHGELKFSKANAAIRKEVLIRICGYETDFGFVILRKSKVHQHLREDLNLLYRYVVIDPIMEMILPFLGEGENLRVVVDKSIPQRKLRYEFNSYIEMRGFYYSRKAERQLPLYRHMITTEHVDSQREPCLQAVDCLAGAEFHRFERSNYDYHNIIEPWIKGELYRYLW